MPAPLAIVIARFRSVELPDVRPLLLSVIGQNYDGWTLVPVAVGVDVDALWRSIRKITKDKRVQRPLVTGQQLCQRFRGDDTTGSRCVTIDDDCMMMPNHLPTLLYKADFEGRRTPFSGQQELSPTFGFDMITLRASHSTSFGVNSRVIPDERLRCGCFLTPFKTAHRRLDDPLCGKDKNNMAFSYVPTKVDTLIWRRKLGV